jgi:hypothetical protein
MADRVKKVSYAHVMVPNRAGQGLKVLEALRAAGVNLSAFSAFPARRRNTQVDLVTDELAELKRVARKNGWRLSDVKKAFVIQGDDRVGAVHRHIAKLAAAKINVTAAAAVTSGRRFGMLLWVKPRDYVRAARALGAR